MRQLTITQMKFVGEYLLGGNGICEMGQRDRIHRHWSRAMVAIPGGIRLRSFLHLPVRSKLQMSPSWFVLA
jgi:hypothetical protein